MRRLAEPTVLKRATAAAVLTALACCPRFIFLQERVMPVWFLTISAFLCSIVLWSFVFAWHTAYTGRPVWIRRPDPKLFAAVTVVGLIVGLFVHGLVDPALRAQAPGEFPPNLQQWFAWLLFVLSLNQLFVVFAPFAFFIRLFLHPLAAAILTALFGVFILVNKLSTLNGPLPSSLIAMLIISRLIGTYFAVAIYLRGGILLASWWTLLLEARLLLDFV
jgi:hypothetical protein